MGFVKIYLRFNSLEKKDEIGKGEEEVRAREDFIGFYRLVRVLVVRVIREIVKKF